MIRRVSWYLHKELDLYLYMFGNCDAVYSLNHSVGKMEDQPQTAACQSSVQPSQNLLRLLPGNKGILVTAVSLSQALHSLASVSKKLIA